MSPPREENLVRIAREGKGWRLEDLSKACGRSKGMLSMIEGGYEGSHTTRELIAKALELPLAKLWPHIYTENGDSA